MKNGTHIDAEKVRRWLSRAKANNNYFAFIRIYGLLMSKLEALFLQDLINRYEVILNRVIEGRYKKHRKRPPLDESGYFKCSVEFLKSPKYLIWSDKEQERLFPLLEKRGLIKLKRKGIPSRRWVYIDQIEIERQVDAMRDNLPTLIDPGALPSS